MNILLGNKKFKIHFEVAEVRQAILSVASMEDNGFLVSIGAARRSITRGTMNIPIETRGRFYVVEGSIVSVNRPSLQGRTANVMPLEEKMEGQLPGEEHLRGEVWPPGEGHDPGERQRLREGLSLGEGQRPGERHGPGEVQRRGEGHGPGKGQPPAEGQRPGEGEHPGDGRRPGE